MNPSAARTSLAAINFMLCHALTRIHNDPENAAKLRWPCFYEKINNFNSETKYNNQISRDCASPPTPHPHPPGRINASPQSHHCGERRLLTHSSTYSLLTTYNFTQCQDDFFFWLLLLLCLSMCGLTLISRNGVNNKTKQNKQTNKQTTTTTLTHDRRDLP